MNNSQSITKESLRSFLVLTKKVVDNSRKVNCVGMPHNSEKPNRFHTSFLSGISESSLGQDYSFLRFPSFSSSNSNLTKLKEEYK